VGWLRKAVEKGERGCVPFKIPKARIPISPSSPCIIGGERSNAVARKVKPKRVIAKTARNSKITGPDQNRLAQALRWREEIETSPTEKATARATMLPNQRATAQPFKGSLCKKTSDPVFRARAVVSQTAPGRRPTIRHKMIALSLIGPLSGADSAPKAERG